MVYRTPLSLAHSRRVGSQEEIRTPNNGGLSTARLPIAPLGQRHQLQRKTRDSNPHAPKGNRVSTATRPTVSGYLPLLTKMRYLKTPQSQEVENEFGSANGFWNLYL